MSGPHDQSPNPPQWPDLPLWISALVLAAIFIGDGILQLLGRSVLAPLVPLADWPEWLPPTVGVIEIGAAALLLVPSLASAAAVGLGLIMAGGIYLNLRTGTGPLFLSPLFVCGGLALLGYERSGPVRSFRRLKSVLNAYAEQEILREELRRGEVPTSLASRRPRSGRAAIPTRG